METDRYTQVHTLRLGWGYNGVTDVLGRGIYMYYNTQCINYAMLIHVMPIHASCRLPWIPRWCGDSCGVPGQHGLTTFPLDYTLYRFRFRPI